MATTKSKFLVKHGLAVNTQSGSSSTLNYPTADGTVNQVIKTDGSGNLSFDSAVSSFINLTDTPANYTSSANKTLIVDSTGSKIEFSNITAQNNVSRESFTASGDSNVITLANTYVGPNYVLVFVDGVIQFPGTNFSLDSTVLTFTATPDSDARIEIFGSNGSLITVPGDTTVSAAKLTNPLALPDNHKITFGNSGDLEIYRRPASYGVPEANIINGVIDSISANNLSLPLNQLMRFGSDPGAYDYGQMYHSGTTFWLLNNTGDVQLRNAADNKDIYIVADNGIGGNANYLKASGSTGELILYYYGTQKFKTDVNGINVTGNVQLSGDITAGTGADIDLTADAIGKVVIKGNATRKSGAIAFNDSSNFSAITLQGPSGNFSDKTLRLPDSTGYAGGVLKTDGSGNLGWTTEPGTTFSIRGDSAGTGVAKFILADGTYTGGAPYNMEIGQWVGDNRTIRIPNMSGEMMVKGQASAQEYIILNGQPTGFMGATDKAQFVISAHGEGNAGMASGLTMSQIVSRHRNRGSATTEIEIIAGAGTHSNIKLDADSAQVTGDLNVSGGLTCAQVTGGLNVIGALTATTKSFDIVHPTKEDMRLRYGSLEGPENGVYVRGKLENSNIIELPDYWIGLVDDNTITVSLTPIGRYNEVWVDKIENNKVYINSSYGNIQCFYHVFGERKDVDKLQVEYDKRKILR